MQMWVNVPDENLPEIKRLMKAIGTEDLIILFNKALTSLAREVDRTEQKKVTIHRTGTTILLDHQAAKPQEVS